MVFKRTVAMEKHDSAAHTLLTFQSDLIQLSVSGWPSLQPAGPFQTDSDVDGRKKEPAAAAAGPSTFLQR